MTRSRRAGVAGRWIKANGEKTSRHGVGMRWRARYVDDRGREHTKAFTRKVDATRWLYNQTASIVSGTHVAPRDAQLTVQQWCDLWIEGYKGNANPRCAKPAPIFTRSWTSSAACRCRRCGHPR